MGRPSKDEKTLSPEDIIEVALDMLTREGEASLSFRKLAIQLGVTPMAVKHHVGTRRELQRSIIARVYRDVGKPVDDGTPHANLRLLLTNYSKRVLAHPNVAVLVFSDPSLLEEGPLASLNEQICANIALLVRSKAERDSVLDVVVDYTHGFAFAAAAAKGKKRPTIKGFQRGLDWILERL